MAKSAVDALRAALDKRKWGPTRLARESKTHQPSVSAFLNDRRGVALETAERWAKAVDFEVSPLALVKHRPSKSPRAAGAR